VENLGGVPAGFIVAMFVEMADIVDFGACRLDLSGQGQRCGAPFWAA